MLPTGSNMANPTPTHMLTHDYESELKYLDGRIDKYQLLIDDLQDKVEALDKELESENCIMRFFDSTTRQELHDAHCKLRRLYYCASKYRNEYTKLMHEYTEYKVHVREECEKLDEGREKITAEIASTTLDSMSEVQKVCYLSLAYPNSDLKLFLNNGGTIEFRGGNHPQFFYGKDNALYFETEDGALEIIMDCCIDGIELGKPNA